MFEASEGIESSHVHRRARFPEQSYEWLQYYYVGRHRSQFTYKKNFKRISDAHDSLSCQRDSSANGSVFSTRIFLI